MKKIRWGILSTARIGTEKVIPAMQRGACCEVTAIASRDLQRARQAASRLGIPKAYGSYDELLRDADIDASTILFPTTCTFRFRSRRSRQASTCCARSLSP